MFLSKLGYSELVQRLFEKMTFSLVDPLIDFAITLPSLALSHSAFSFTTIVSSMAITSAVLVIDCTSCPFAVASLIIPSA